MDFKHHFIFITKIVFSFYLLPNSSVFKEQIIFYFVNPPPPPKRRRIKTRKNTLKAICLYCGRLHLLVPSAGILLFAPLSHYYNVRYWRVLHYFGQGHRLAGRMDARAPCATAEGLQFQGRDSIKDKQVKLIPYKKPELLYFIKVIYCCVRTPDFFFFLSLSVI